MANSLPSSGVKIQNAIETYMGHPLKIALLCLEMRESDRNYLAPEPRFHTAVEALLQGFARLPEVEIHVVTCTQQRMTAPEKIAPNIFYHNLVVPKLGWLRTGYQGCIRATRKKLREIQPDIVHGQGTERDSALSAIFSGFPNLITIHGNMRLIARVQHARPFSFHWLAGQLERFTIPRTAGVVCITNYTRVAVEPLARRTWLLPNAVDASFFDVQPKPTPGEAPVILCVGTIDQRKNQNAFIRALDLLASQKKFKVVFLGRPDSGNYGSEFLQLVKARAWCEHIGFADRARVKEFFQTATALALPTVEDNCPMVVLEAMAAGVPVLASRVGGVPDLIESEKTGLFCDPNRPESFCEGVARLLADRELAQRLATSAKAEALRRFHPLTIARQHLEIYHEVLRDS